jgi:ribose transport system substrate-binding protein
MKKILATLLALTMMLTFVVGCTAKDADKTSTPSANATTQDKTPETDKEDGAKDEIVIGVVTKIIDPFFQKLIDGCIARGEELGIKVIYGAASNSTAIEEQINIIEDMIVQGVDGLIIVPIDSKALVPVAVKAIEQGISVVNFDNKFDPETVQASGIDYIPFVGIDNEQAAYMVVKYLCEYLNGEGKVAICEGTRGADNATLRSNGAIRAFEEYAGIEIVASQPGDFVTDTAYAAFANVFQAHPEITAVFCSGDLMALGVIQAAQEAGLADQITIAGFDCDPANLVYIKEGKQLCDLDQNPSAISAKAVDVCIAMINGETPDSLYNVDPIVVSVENVEPYLEAAGLN